MAEGRTTSLSSVPSNSSPVFGEGIFSSEALPVIPPQVLSGGGGYAFSAPKSLANDKSRTLESILTRQSLLSLSSLSESQRAVDNAVARSGDFISNPRNLAFLVGGGVLVGMGRNALRLEEMEAGLSTLTSTVTSTPRWRWLGVTVLPVMAVGCGANTPEGHPFQDGGGGADSTDSHPVFPDHDGDGFASDVDCDDNDPNVHPLPIPPMGAGGLVSISSSMTICPGLYQGVRLAIETPGSSGITVVGDGVTLDGTALQGLAVPRPGLLLEGANNVTIQGFNFMNFRSSPGVVYLNQAPNAVFNNTIVNVGEGFDSVMAFHINDSNDVTLSGVRAYFHADRALELYSSDRLTVRNSVFRGLPPTVGVQLYGVLALQNGTGHLIADNTIQAGKGAGIQLIALNHATLLRNQIISNGGDGIYGSTLHDSTIDQNVVTGNGGYGIHLYLYSTNNSVTNNNFTGNTLGSRFIEDPLSSIGNVFLGNTPAP